jgi:hypothetical protein
MIGVVVVVVVVVAVVVSIVEALAMVRCTTRGAPDGRGGAPGLRLIEGWTTAAGGLAGGLAGALVWELPERPAGGRRW